ncbi:MAG: BrnA antitoxin family protein [Deltaproteobacteria bacterium]|nr:BrnA antitoxin family protein [Deltaproteobacteria bacterium]
MHDKDFEPQNVKQRVSIMLDSDIITAARNQAQSRGTRYQTLINEVLRQILIDGNSANKEVLELARSITDGIAALAESRSVEGRLNRIEEKLDNLSVKVS